MTNKEKKLCTGSWVCQKCSAKNEISLDEKASTKRWKIALKDDDCRVWNMMERRKRVNW
jgi:hypothetical protein